MTELPPLSISYILLFAAFIAPGAVSIFVYRLLTPATEHTLKEILLEATTFSLMNFSILFWAILYAVSPEVLKDQPFISWGIIILCLFIAPGIWPVVLLRVLALMESRGLLLGGAKTAWDRFFENAKTGCWIIVHLNNGESIGGRFSQSSYASAYPREGHLYIQELWCIDESGNFTQELPGPQGAILRPTDYRYLRVFRSDHDRK